MSRIVAGEARGRRLSVPDGKDTRPTSDRVRESLFGSLSSELGSLEGLRFLDLYAGSGAVGIEALSRGASAVVLVEVARRAVGVIRDNLRTVGLPGASLLAGRVERVVGGPPPEPDGFDVVYVDPPYSLPDASVAAVLRDLAGNGWLAPDAVVVVERSARSAAFTWPPGFTADRMRKYGDTALWYGHAADGDATIEG
ncbi:16S rRNA (guanine(966)-N(2))-methyltransferase RsmD [Actinopolymorpha singaporensis]|uniref:16S rRNA (Guanine966-N2)-methyltransferase n=1 Tax=Actinopolymorpha singaporensis TaxID=117157 RepID=A0A1H1Y5P8_9ACTN|nr:16S rRNA (guanine(966)-N(2))-methyltransferase RsmD [Actinopolymorpha singaporensis]SDT16356.1 16S rRNA (guanine966-N2)-methyltransferase [Actinopolymorpha singaporensis]